MSLQTVQKPSGRPRNPGILQVQPRQVAPVRMNAGLGPLPVGPPPLPTITSVPRNGPPSPSSQSGVVSKGNGSENIPGPSIVLKISDTIVTSPSAADMSPRGATSPTSAEGKLILQGDLCGRKEITSEVKVTPKTPSPVSPGIEIRALPSSIPIALSAPTIRIPLTARNRPNVDLTATPPPVAVPKTPPTESIKFPARPTSPVRSMPPPQPLPVPAMAVLPSPRRAAVARETIPVISPRARETAAAQVAQTVALQKDHVATSQPEPSKESSSHPAGSSKAPTMAVPLSPQISSDSTPITLPPLVAKPLLPALPPQPKISEVSSQQGVFTKKEENSQPVRVTPPRVARQLAKQMAKVEPKRVTPISEPKRTPAPVSKLVPVEPSLPVSEPKRVTPVSEPKRAPVQPSLPIEPKRVVPEPKQVLPEPSLPIEHKRLPAPLPKPTEPLREIPIEDKPGILTKQPSRLPTPKHNLPLPVQAAEARKLLIPVTSPVFSQPLRQLPLVSPPVLAKTRGVVSPPMPRPPAAKAALLPLPSQQGVAVPLPEGGSQLRVTSPVEPYRTPGRIQQRVDVPPTSARPLAVSLPAPAIPVVDVRPIGAIYPASPQQGSQQGSLPGNSPSVNQNPAGSQFAAPFANTLPTNNNGPIKPPRPNYAAMTVAQQGEMRSQFRAKFGILRQSFPQWQVVDPPESATLDQWHDIYEGYVRQIIVSLNCNQWKVYLVIAFLAIEVFCIKVLGLDARGFTMSQVKIMNRYDQVLVELGEKYYVQGPSNWPVEARILMMAAFNGVIFIAVKYLSKWLGGDSMASGIQSVVDQFLSGGNLFGAPVQRDAQGIPIPPGMAPQQAASPQPGAPQPAASSGLDGLAGMLSGLMNGQGGSQVDLTSMLANLGNAITSNMRPAGSTQAPAQPAAQPAAQPFQSCATEARAKAPPPRRVPRFDA